LSCGGAAGPGYELLDAGDGRKLERFGGRVVDRPCPGARRRRSLPEERWRLADGRYRRGRGWSGELADEREWSVRLAGFVFHLRAGRSGQLGLFPEHRRCWRWINQHRGGGDRHLNLFAHTGGATLVAARAGAAVCHVDGSRPAVARARRNAEASGLADRPVRWIVDDVGKFVGRELRRGREYDAVLLDPPAFGRGPGGERWKLEQVIEKTLAEVFALLSERPRFVLLSAHSRGLERSDLESWLRSASPTGGHFHGEELWLGRRAGPRLPAGFWSAWAVD